MIDQYTIRLLHLQLVFESHLCAVDFKVFFKHKIGLAETHGPSSNSVAHLGSQR